MAHVITYGIKEAPAPYVINFYWHLRDITALSDKTMFSHFCPEVENAANQEKVTYKNPRWHLQTKAGEIMSMIQSVAFRG